VSSAPGPPRTPAASREAERGLRDVAKITAGRLATQAVLVVSAFLIPRALGAASFGLFAALMAMLAIVQAAAAFGFPLVEARFLAPLWRQGERGRAVELGSSIWAARLLLSIGGAAAFAVWLALSPELGTGTTLLGWAVLLVLLRLAHEASKSLLLPVGRVGSLAAFDFARAALTLPLVLVLHPLNGLAGVFAGMAGMQLVLLVASSGLLWRATGLEPARLAWGALRPHLGYSTAAFVGSASAMFQAQFGVYAAANWVARDQAAYLGVAAQIYGLLQVLYISGRRALVPLLSEFEARGQVRRLALWGGIMLRYGAAATSPAIVLWALLGRDLVRLALTDAFAPVYGCTAWILVSVMFYCAAASCNGLLYVRGRAARASANVLTYALATAAGLVLALRSPAEEAAALRISMAYAAAAALFFADAWLSLARAGHIILPLRRTLSLMAPALLALPAARLEGGLPARAGAAALFLLGYAGLAVALGWLPARELRQILRSAGRLRRAGDGEPATAGQGRGRGEPPAAAQG
jgi:O-antigen/teichoic acid export membrane protein